MATSRRPTGIKPQSSGQASARPVREDHEPQSVLSALEGPLRPAFLSVKAFAVVMGLSENTVLRRIGDGQIRATRIGRLWRIPVSEIARLLG